MHQTASIPARPDLYRGCAHIGALSCPVSVAGVRLAAVRTAGTPRVRAAGTHAGVAQVAVKLALALAAGMTLALHLHLALAAHAYAYTRTGIHSTLLFAPHIQFLNILI